MEKAEYYKMEELEKNYWWHRGKVYLIETVIDKIRKELRKDKLNILEIGCGTGITLKTLAKYGEVTGIDVSEDSLQFCRKKGFDKVTLGDVTTMDLSQLVGQFDLVVSLDVLEHIQDDVEAIKRVHSLLKPGSYFFVNVPAHKFLWSEHDEALHHKRRYSMSEITQKLIDCGFKIESKTFFVSTMFFPIAFFRLLTNFFTTSTYPKTSYIMLPEFANNILTSMLKAEAKLINFLPLPFGVTITIVARKD